MTKKNIENGEAIVCSSCLLKLSYIIARMEKIESALYSIKGTLNFKEAREYLDLSNSQLYKLTRNGDIPYYKPTGKLIYFNKQELDEWVCRNHSEASVGCEGIIAEIDKAGTCHNEKSNADSRYQKKNFKS
ncbi:helix-turn-helix domain-containing protein [Bacteroides ovatus]|uniref:helix-turn-helix domain-containing protein n=1 Tax=Bacteroides ovatus TaxID=28116 RepID=UPI0022E88EF1|nr:helix-turn-helix domain-containing protein [Bacteroides ovatus]